VVGLCIGQNHLVTVEREEDLVGLQRVGRLVRLTLDVMTADRSPRVWVIDPDLFDGAKDPGEVIQRRGPRAWERTATAPVSGITAYSLELAGPISTWQSESGRRAGLARTSTWLASLHSRHSIEQASALDAAANTLGYDAEATRHTFRAQHWHEHVTRSGPLRGLDR
jgi:hypothetical protein